SLVGVSVCSTVTGAEGAGTSAGAGAAAGAIGAAAAAAAGGAGAGASRTPSTVICSARGEPHSPPAPRHARNATMARPAVTSTTRYLGPDGFAANPNRSLSTTNCLGVITAFQTPVRVRVQATPNER